MAFAICASYVWHDNLTRMPSFLYIHSLLLICKHNTKSHLLSSNNSGMSDPIKSAPRVSLQFLTSHPIPLYKCIRHSIPMHLSKRLLARIQWRTNSKRTLHRNGRIFAGRYGGVEQRDVIIAQWDTISKQWLVQDIDEASESAKAQM